MNATPDPENPMSAVSELAEVFKLGGSLARIETTLGHVATTGEKTNVTVTGMQGVIGGLQVQLGQHSTILQALVPRVQKLEDAPEHDHTQFATKGELQEVKDEVKGNRLSWPKVGALVVGAGGIVTLATFADKVIPG